MSGAAHRRLRCVKGWTQAARQNRSEATCAGGWLAYRRNVVDDYRRVFGADPGPVRDVGVMTDSDDLKTRSETWYGDLSFHAG